MACSKCGFLGYKVTFYHTSAKARPMIAQCFDCNDIEAYSRQVQLMMTSPEEAFKRLGQKEPFIGREMNVTGKGIEIKSKPASERKEGEPCPVIPFKRS